MWVIEAARGLAGELDKGHGEKEMNVGLHQNVGVCQLGCGLPTARFHEAWSAASFSTSNLLSTYGITVAWKADESTGDLIPIGRSFSNNVDLLLDDT